MANGAAAARPLAARAGPAGVVFGVNFLLRVSNRRLGLAKIIILHMHAAEARCRRPMRRLRIATGAGAAGARPRRGRSWYLDPGRPIQRSWAEADDSRVTASVERARPHPARLIYCATLGRQRRAWPWQRHAAPGWRPRSQRSTHQRGGGPPRRCPWAWAAAASARCGGGCGGEVRSAGCVPCGPRVGHGGRGRAHMFM